MAKIQASDNPLNIVDGEGFLQALYGYDYIQGMQAWGAQATMDDVAQEFENWMAGRGLSGRSLNKVTSEDILSLFRKPSGEGLESFWRTVLAYRLFQGRMKAFSNIDDIERMFNQVKIAKIKAKIEKTRSALVAWRDALFEQYKSLSDADGWAALEQLANNGVDGAKLAIVQADNPLESPAAQWIKVGAVINAFDEKHISKDDFADAVSVNRLVEMATRRARELKDGDYVNELPDTLKSATWQDYVSLKNGGATESEIAERLEQAESKEKSRRQWLKPELMKRRMMTISLWLMISRFALRRVFAGAGGASARTLARFISLPTNQVPRQYGTPKTRLRRLAGVSGILKQTRLLM